MKNLIKFLTFAIIISIFTIAPSRADNPSTKNSSAKFPVAATPSCNNCNQPYFSQYPNQPYNQQPYNQRQHLQSESSSNNRFYHPTDRNNRYYSNHCANCGIQLSARQTNSRINAYNAQFVEPSQHMKRKREEKYYQNQPYKLCDRCINNRSTVRPPVILRPNTPSNPQPVPAPNRQNLSQPVPVQPQHKR